MPKRHDAVTDSNVNLNAYTPKNGFNSSQGNITKNELDNPKNSANKNDGLSLFHKLCFAVAGMSYQLHFCALGVFTSVFLLNRANLPPEKNM